MKKRTLDEFLESYKPTAFPVSEWVTFEDGEMYVRLTWRFFDREQKATIESANVVRPCRHDNMTINPNMESSGFMKRRMEKIEGYARRTGRIVFVESVLNEFLPRWYFDRGYELMPQSCPPSFYFDPSVREHA